jgi:hypothetical protein
MSEYLGEFEQIVFLTIVHLAKGIASKVKGSSILGLRTLRRSVAGAPSVTFVYCQRAPRLWLLLSQCLTACRTEPR